jgi:trehalose-6-phosphate synthase
VSAQLASQRRLVALVRERFHDRKLVVVSNREPIVHRRLAEGGIETLHPASGMTTALVPLLAATGGVWVAHGSGSADFDVTDARDGLACPTESPAYRLRRVRLSPEVERGYYFGLANEGIWPLCHIAYTAPIFRHSDWDHYAAANEAFAAAVLDEIGDSRALVFVQDYHLALVPSLLRAARPDLLIAHFWHIPWPNREVMRVMPWLDQLLDGLLGNDLLGFHVQHHCNNFLDTVDRSIEALVDVEHARAVRKGHPTFVRPFPISIDGAAYAKAANAGEFDLLYPELADVVRDQIVLLGVDRLDYTKGIPHRLRMLESLLERHAEFVGRVTLVQIGAPTRSTITRYADHAREIAELAEAINDRFARGSWRPVRYVPEHLDRDALAPLYRRADACLVTSLHDGMNLVAKEYVAAHAGSPGTLLLSKFTGAARELHEACLVNPYDIEGSADALAASLRLPDEIRSDAMARLWGRVQAHDVYAWAADLLQSLDEISRRREALTFPGN